VTSHVRAGATWVLLQFWHILATLHSLVAWTSSYKSFHACALRKNEMPQCQVARGQCQGTAKLEDSYCSRSGERYFEALFPIVEDVDPSLGVYEAENNGVPSVQRKTDAGLSSHAWENNLKCPCHSLCSLCLCCCAR